MKVGELKKLLINVPDDVEVVVSGSDHSYVAVGRQTGIVKAEHHKSRWREFSQYFETDEHRDPVIDVLWIDDGRY